MSEAKFTPGPWETINGTDVFTRLGATNKCGVKADDDDGWQIADCSVNATFVNGELLAFMPDETRANAALIAAAPDLYEALDRAAMLLSGVGFESSDEYQEAMHILAKARGES